MGKPESATSDRPAALDSARTLIALPEFMRRQALQYFLQSLSEDERAMVIQLGASLPPQAGRSFLDLIAHIEAWR